MEVQKYCDAMGRASLSCATRCRLHFLRKKTISMKKSKLVFCVPLLSQAAYRTVLTCFPSNNDFFDESLFKKQVCFLASVQTITIDQDEANCF